MSDQENTSATSVPDAGAVNPAVTGFTPGPVSIGSVFGKSFSVLFGNILKFILITAFLWVPSILFTIFILGGTTSTSGGTLELSAQGPAAFVYGIVMFAAGTVMYGAVIHMTCQSLAGRPTAVGAAIGKGFSRFFPLLIAYIVLSLLVSVGLLLLIVPGLWALATFALLLPAVVAENMGPFSGMSRSAALTKGYRWKVIGASVLLFVLIIAVSFASQFIISLAAAIGGTISVSTTLIIAVTGTSILQMLIYLYMLIFYTVLYHQIRIAKEGSSAEEIASVFD